MRIRELLREISRDLVSGAARAGLYLMLLAVSLTLLASHEVLSVTALIDQAQRYRDVGADVRIVVMADAIDGERCVALGRIEGVESAAVRNRPDTLSPSVMSTVPLALLDATPSIASILEATTQDGTAVMGPGVLLSASALEYVYIGQDAGLSTTTDFVPIAGTFPYPSDGRRAGLGYAAILPEPVSEKPYDECWLRAWPERTDAVSLLNSTVIATEGLTSSAPELIQLNGSLGSEFLGAQSFDERLSRFNGLLALGIGALIGAISMFSRRLELAAKLHSAVTRGDLIRIHVGQSAVWIVIGSVIACLASALLFASYADALWPLAQLVLRIVGFGALGALGGSVIVTLTIRESSLFKFFKER